MAEEKACVFCDIVAGKCPKTVIVFSNENILIFEDIRPASEHHYLAIPKKHMHTVRSLNADDKDLIIEMQEQLRQLLSSKGVNMDDVSYGFHWPPFNSIDHLHMHAIAPASKMRFTAKIVFKPINLWFCTTEYVLSKLKPAN